MTAPALIVELRMESHPVARVIAAHASDEARLLHDLEQHGASLALRVTNVIDVTLADMRERCRHLVAADLSGRGR